MATAWVTPKARSPLSALTPDLRPGLSYGAPSGLIASHSLLSSLSGVLCREGSM
jgi:hypothetical protein